MSHASSCRFSVSFSTFWLVQGHVITILVVRLFRCLLACTLTCRFRFSPWAPLRSGRRSHASVLSRTSPSTQRWTSSTCLSRLISFKHYRGRHRTAGSLLRLLHVVKRTIGIYAMQLNHKINHVCVVFLLWHCSLNSSNQSFLSGHITHGLARTTKTTGEASGAVRLPPAHQGARGEPKEVRTHRGHYKRLSPFSVEMYRSRTASLLNSTFCTFCSFNIFGLCFTTLL